MSDTIKKTWFIGGSETSSLGTSVKYQHDHGISTGTIYVGSAPHGEEVHFPTIQELRSFMGMKLSSEFFKKEGLYKTAINNLFKRVNYLELNQMLDTHDIDDDQFLDELDKNPAKYTIECRANVDPESGKMVIEIVNGLDSTIRELTLSEVAELFSLDESIIINSLNTSKLG